MAFATLDLDSCLCSREVNWLPAGALAVRSPLDLRMQPGLGGGIVWEAATILTRYLVQQQSRGAHRPDDGAVVHILELGSGTGVCGLVAAAQSPSNHVTVTDQRQQLQLLQQNIAANSASLASSGCHPPAAQVLDFEKACMGDVPESKGGGERDMSWVWDTALPAWDKILISDCTYPPELPGAGGTYEEEEAAAWRPLMLTLQQLCLDSLRKKELRQERAGVEVLLAHTTRSEGDVERLTAMLKCLLGMSVHVREEGGGCWKTGLDPADVWSMVHDIYILEIRFCSIDTLPTPPPP